ncbi:hypothetical protein Trad_2544 [Truepera radiovictrix DSM 17093]|uniref:Uncharacterized protein n=2 Tax=Truepera TaxID=332248 RepID=D7CTV3_TRURR|nr:hypothetical protein Trad_2544 [Truepera radiovictrix DSM 17093]
MLVEVRTPRTLLEKGVAQARSAWLRLRRRVVAYLYESLPPLYAPHLVKPQPGDLSRHWEKLARCAEADRLARETLFKEMREDDPTLADAWSESGGLEDEVRESWERLLTSCSDRYLFPLRSRLQNRVYLIEVSAEADVHATGWTYAETFVGEPQARERLGAAATLVTLPPFGTPYWLAGTVLLDVCTGEAWRVLDRQSRPLELLKNPPSPTVEIEPGGIQPYPVLVLPIQLERLADRHP